MVSRKKVSPVRVNMILKGDHAKLLHDMKDRKIITSYPEGIRLVLTKFKETPDTVIHVVKFEGIKKEEK